ncbi:MAG: tetratricopeptide repeat protein, partial [Vicinamibacteraceae bacterium]
MSELQHARHLLEEAEQAATAGDLASADTLMRRAARIQEAELGARHPDLAHTLNNLAIVAERSGRVRDAEIFYR